MTIVNISKLLLPILATVTYTSCDSQTDSLTFPDPEPIGINFSSDLSFTNGKTSRVDLSDATDEKSSQALKPDEIGVFGVSDVSGRPLIFENQIFYYINGDTYKNLPDDFNWAWPSNFSWPNTNEWPYPNVQYWDNTWKDTEANRRNYQFYAYAPHTSYYEGLTANVSDFAYDKITTFTLSKIPPFSSKNYMIAKKYEQTKSGIMPTFDMLNLSARICMRLKIGQEYSRLRKIRITEITVNDREANSAQYYKCEFPLSNVSVPTPIFTNDGTYVPKSSGAVIPVIPIFEDQYGLLLTQTYQQFGSLYCMPQQLENITINVKYNVYDLEPDEFDSETGTLKNIPIRKDQRVSNEVSIGRDVKSGYYYNINIVVSPDYLYVLSDNDVKPDVVIGTSD